MMIISSFDNFCTFLFLEEKNVHTASNGKSCSFGTANILTSKGEHNLITDPCMSIDYYI